MPRSSAPGAIRRCYIPQFQFREPVPTYRRRAFAARPPGREPPSAVLPEQVSPGSWQDGDRPLRPARTDLRLASCCRQRSWPPLGSTSTPCPCHESRRSSGEAPSHHPCPNRPRSSASLADRSSGPAAATPSAAPRPPGHMPPPAFTRWHIPAQVTQICPLRASHADRQDLRHIGGQGSPLNRSCAGQRPAARVGVAGPTPGLTCGFCSFGRRFTPVKWRAQSAVARAGRHHG